MAGIDKTYITSVEQYKELYNWCKSVGTITDDYGNKITPMDYLIPESEEEVSRRLKNVEEIPIWNTDNIFDLYLIRYCPIQFVQDRMNEVYDEGFVQSVKNRKSEYDTFRRNGVKNPHYKIKAFENNKIKSKQQHWEIEIIFGNAHMDYFEREDKWRYYYEAYYGFGDGWIKYHDGHLCKRKLHRWIKKWDLPKESRVFLYCRKGNGLKRFKFIIK